MPSPQQYSTAYNLFIAFTLMAMRYAMLVAQCQAGKTGAFQELIRMMLEKGVVKRVYILCGSNEIELHAQAIADTKKANPVAYAEGRIKVIFRSQFKKAMMNIKKALIVVDESHLDQGRDMELDIFLRKHKLTMDGNPKRLEKKKCFILSVDATPYSELAALAHKQTPFTKHIEFLETGPSYYGLADYTRERRINETFDIASDPDSFARLFKPNKWALIRLSGGKKAKEQEAAIKQVCVAKGYRVLYFTAEKEDTAPQVRITDLEDAPSVPTVVIVRGRLRAGKVVCKKHIAFVWEGAATSKTDSLVQGLLGRMCGYEFGEEKPMIFVPSSALKEYENKVVTVSELGRAMMGPLVLPTKGTNLKKPHVANRAYNGTHECVPLRLTVPNNDDWNFTSKFEVSYRTGKDRLAIGRSCHNLLLKNLHLIRDSPNYSAEQKEEILKQIESADLTAPHTFALRHLEGESQVGYFKKLHESYETNAATGELIGECLPLNFIVTYRDYKAEHANSRQLYVVFYTKVSGIGGGMGHAHLKSRIPMASENCIFTDFKGHMDAPMVAIGFVGFKETALKGPAEFSAALREYMHMQHTAVHLSLARRIADIGKAFRMDKKTFAYKSNTDNDIVRICDAIGRERGLYDVKARFARSSAGADGHFNLAEITWGQMPV